MAGKLIRVATWNVERPKPRGWKVPPAQRRRMAEVDADIWVLTETHLGHAPTDEHLHSVSLLHTLNAGLNTSGGRPSGPGGR